MDMEIDKCKSDEVNDWFLNKFGAQARARPKKELDIKEKEKLSIERYKKMREQIEEQLAARRREDMQRRHRFYNADNELSNQSKQHDDEEEEEGFTDEDEEENCEFGSIKDEECKGLKEGNDNNERDDCEIDEDDMEAGDEEDGDVEVVDEDCDDNDDGDECEEVVDDNSNSFIRKLRRKHNSFDGEEESLCKRPRLVLSSDDDMTCDKVVIIDEDSRTRFPPDPVVNNNGDGGEFSHITLDLNAATTNPPCSQDFNEALFLCSGTFAENEEASKGSVEKNSSPQWKNLKNDDLFTVEDDAEESTAAGGSWPIKWTEEEDDDDLEDEDGDIQRNSKPIKIKDILDDEASLSGDDVGGDSDDSDAGEEDDYEPEEGDNDELPDEEEIREKLVRQYIKQTNDDDERRMIQLQEQFFVDSDLHSSTNMDRSFRFRMRDDANVDWTKVLGNLDDQQKENSDNEDDEDAAKRIAEKKIEMLKWRLEQEKKKCVFNDSKGVEYVEMFEKSSILMLGEKSITNKGKKMNSSESIAARPISTNENELATLRSRDSLLNKAGGSLRHVFKDTTAPTNNHSLFTSISKK